MKHLLHYNDLGCELKILGIFRNSTRARLSGIKTIFCTLRSPTGAERHRTSA
ncbi:MAG: hypothetical protein KME40_34845 [Komarekiella atlantica HA4396-MV6]|nr:hypothetical protein [Komarekiella atlantica HA4396-MV6]